MGTAQLFVPPGKPLGCLLDNFKSLCLAPDLRASRLTNFCNKTWLQYSLDNGFKSPLNGTLNPNILRDLFNYCQQSRKRKEVPYVQAFFLLCSKPSLCSSCSHTQLLLAVKSPPQESSTTLDPADEIPLFKRQPSTIQSTSPPLLTSSPSSRPSPGTPLPRATSPSSPGTSLLDTSSPGTSPPALSPASHTTVRSNHPTLAPTFTPPIPFSPPTTHSLPQQSLLLPRLNLNQLQFFLCGR